MSAETAVLAYIEDHQGEMFDCLSRLIQINTENFIHSGNEEACAVYLRQLYEQAGMHAEIYYPDHVIPRAHPGYIPNRGTDKRPNVAGMVKGTQGARRLMLAAHTDTVPIGDPHTWTEPPLGGTLKNGRIYGRGSNDNKFGLASAFFALDAIRRCGIRLKQDVILSAYCDEEYGGGNGSVASCIKYPCDTYINLDGGNSEIWVASVGGQGFTAEIEAMEPQDTCELIVDGLGVIRDSLRPFAQNRYDELSHNPYYQGTDIHRSCFRITAFNCGNLGIGLSEGKLDFVFYTDKLKAQVLSELSGAERAITAACSAMGIRFNGFRPVTRYFDYACAREDDPSITLMRDCSGDATGTKARLSGACLSDYFLYLQYGSASSFSYGILRDFKLPGGAHQPDEYVECRELVNHAKSLGLYLLRWCGYEPCAYAASAAGGL
jgi:acetylornithine deacetylase